MYIYIYSTAKVYLGRLAFGQKILPLVEIGFALEREKGAVLELVAADCHLNAEQLLKDHQLVAGVSHQWKRCEVSSGNKGTRQGPQASLAPGALTEDDSGGFA
jgi:hypothetical protein